MTGAVLLVVIVFLVVGGFLGWHSNRAYAAHGDIKTTKKGRLPAFRRTRSRSGTIAILIIILVLLALRVLTKM